MMYFFFGASKNCYGAIKFWGKDNVIAVIDNDVNKLGKNIEGIPIIGFEEFLTRREEGKVVITAFVAGKEIAKQLRDNGITDYFFCPYMRSGFCSCEQMAAALEALQELKDVYSYEKDIVAVTLCKYLEQKHPQKYSAHIISEEQNCSEGSLVIYECDKKDYGCAQVLDLKWIVKKMNEGKYDYLHNFSGIHDGERCFLIGTGPSLEISDLEKIMHNKDISISCNKVYRIFEKTQWRPDYYVVIDDNVFRNIKEDLSALGDIPFFFKDFYGTDYDLKNLNSYPFLTYDDIYYPGYPEFSCNIAEGLYGGRTVMYEMLQIAVCMGFKEIYLLGVDFTWGEDGRNAHFMNDPEGDKVVKYTIRNKEEIKHAYTSARRYAEKHGIKIFNATRGGKLEIFERVSFDSLFD